MTCSSAIESESDSIAEEGLDAEDIVVGDVGPGHVVTVVVVVGWLPLRWMAGARVG